MIHKACMPVYMNSGKIVADGRDGTGGKFEGSTRGPRGPKKDKVCLPVRSRTSDGKPHLQGWAV